jgi:hypothetical protein
VFAFSCCFSLLRRLCFLDYVQGHEKAWVTTRKEIALHWRAQHPYQAG